MQQIILHGCYFVVRSDGLDKIRELPRFLYPTLVDAVKAQTGRPEYEVISYHRLWDIVSENLIKAGLQNGKK